MTGLSQTDFARLAGTSQQAVSQAVRASHLTCDAHGRLDPAEPRNAGWITTHREGWGRRGRPLSTWRNGHDDGRDRTALEELLAHWGEVQIDPAFADRLRAELLTEPGQTVLAAILAALPGQLRTVRAEVEALREELRTGRRTEGQEVPDNMVS